MTRNAEKIAALMRRERPDPSIATIGEKRLWNALLAGLAEVLIPKSDRADLLRFSRQAGGRAR